MSQGRNDEYFHLRARRAGVLVVAASSRRSFARHSHDGYGIGLIEAGAQRSASGRGPVEAGAGQAICVNPGEVHDGHPIGDVPRRWQMLYLDVDLVSAIVSDIHEGGNGSFEFSSPVVADPRVGGWLGDLFANATEGEGLAWRSGLVRILAAQGRPRPVVSADACHVRQARDLIDTTPAAAVSLATLAQLSGLSQFQTLRAFVKTTGLTPHAYQVQKRLELARRLIRKGLPLAGAAADSGFSDQSHMNRAFVRVYGYTPGALARAG